ncbi:MAG: mannitol-1-phosphate 5-dehydrogenase [Rikenellaceae bacterium]|nr:mannitol-1-phosphate 5-dehydrogenase [Rikenellaceae bacterium]
MKALHIGAGKIGRGFIGAQLIKSNYELTFADVNKGLIDMLNSQKSYTLHIMECDGESQTITSFNAVEIGSEEFFERFSDADIVTTAVSMKVLPELASTIAAALQKRCINNRKSTLNIICCENGIRATSQLKSCVIQLLDTQTIEWCSDMVGFADCAVDRIVPIATFDNALDVGVERYCEWCIDRGQIVGSLPNIVGVNFTDNLEATIERKLYTVNSAHCATAYLGAIKGYKFIHQAVTDPTIRQIIEQVVAESSAALCAKFGFDADSQRLYAQSVLRRFENPYLGDTVARVARDPMRKLSPALYFAYPTAMALNYNLATEALAIVTAAALHYRSDDDTESQQLSAMVALYGVAKSTEMVTGITDKAFLQCVERKYSDF